MAARMDVVPARQRVDVGVLLALRWFLITLNLLVEMMNSMTCLYLFFISVNTTNVEFYA